MAREIMQTPLQTVADREINQEKIQREQKHGNDDDRRRSLDFLERWRRDFLHLRAHVIVETFNAFRPGPESIAEITARCCD